MMKTQNNHFLLLLIILAFVAVTSGCSKATPNSGTLLHSVLDAPSIQSAAEAATNSLGCKDLESHLWDVSYAVVLNQNSKLTQNPAIKAPEMSKAILNSKFSQKFSEHSRSTLLQLIQKFYEIHEALLNSKGSKQEKLEMLTSLEIGKSSDPESKNIQAQLRAWRQKVSGALDSENITCARPEPFALQFQSFVDSLDTNNDVSVQMMTGARKTFAVAYQSCELEKLPPISKEFPSLSGIETLGKASNGGVIRKITDLSAFLKSDYYYRDFSLGPQCKDLRTNPLIYNFGGKPDIVTSGDEVLFDLFAHGKEGEGVSPQLGIDCSGYVFTSIATSGLRLAPDKDLKPILVYGLGSKMYLEPENNGLTCLKKVSMGQSGTLKDGDIIAVDGHVAIFGQVGADALGIQKITQESDCDKLTDENFDFVIYQSSSSKNGLGINKYLGKDFLSEDSTFRRGLVTYAQQACHARLQQKDVEVYSKEIQVDRFINTAACQESPIHLVGESCVRQCFE